MLSHDRIHHVHFIGICGTGMASLAAMLKERGLEVTGSDEGMYPPMSDFLSERQIRVTPRFDFANLKPAPDLVVVGNAVSRGNPEVEYVLNFRVPHTSFPEALKGFFLREKTSVVIAGTHGKTTTASMIAWVLHHAGFHPDFLIGGILENLHSSFALGGGRHFVIEGDEYDCAFFDKGAKFLHYLPDMAVIGNVEFDHADIYANLEAVEVQFRRFVNIIPARGFLAVGGDCPGAQRVSRESLCQRESFGLDDGNDWSARGIRYENERLCYEALYRKKLFRSFSLPLLGAFNIRNALAATAVLHRMGVPEDDIRGGLEQFRGVRRRQQLIATVRDILVYEDFAHHPTAVRETLQAIRSAHRPARLWAIYEPRSATSRRRVFQDEIAAALAEADCIVMPPLFRPEKVPAGERLDLPRLLADLRSMGRSAWNPDSVEGIIQQVCADVRSGDIVVILSNGGFGDIYRKLPAALQPS